MSNEMMPKPISQLSENDSIGVCRSDMAVSDPRQTFYIMNVYRKESGRIIGRFRDGRQDTKEFDTGTGKSVQDGVYVICMTKQLGPGISNNVAVHVMRGIAQGKF